MYFQVTLADSWYEGKIMVCGAVEDVAVYGHLLLVAIRSSCVIMPPPLISFIQVLLLCLRLLLDPDILPVMVRFSSPSAFITWPEN